MSISNWRGKRGGEAEQVEGVVMTVGELACRQKLRRNSSNSERMS